MAFSFSNLFKSKKDDSIQEIVVPVQKIDFKGGTKYAENETSDVYLDFEELGGFPYIKTIVIGNLKVKIKRTGCSLTFQFKNDTLTIHSDNTDIESNKIKNTPSYYTEIDFELTDKDAAKIKNNKVHRIEYTFKNETESFKTI